MSDPRWQTVRNGLPPVPSSFGAVAEYHDALDSLEAEMQRLAVDYWDAEARVERLAKERDGAREHWHSMQVLAQEMEEEVERLTKERDAWKRMADGMEVERLREALREVKRLAPGTYAEAIARATLEEGGTT